MKTLLQDADSDAQRQNGDASQLVETVERDGARELAGIRVADRGRRGLGGGGIRKLMWPTKQGLGVMPNQVIERKPNGQFAKGSSGNLGGNAQRTRHALNADTIHEMHLAFGRGGRKAIEKVMRNNPAVFLKLLVLLVPREMKVEQSDGIKAMTTEQIERGIELIKEMIAKRDAAASAKVIEGEAVEQKPKRKRGEKVGALSPRILDIASKPTDQGAT